MTYYIMRNMLTSNDELVADGIPDFMENDEDDVYNFMDGNIIWRKPVPIETLNIDDIATAEPSDVIKAPGIGAPLVNEKVKTLLNELNVENIQLFPIKLFHEKANELIDDYYILNVIGKFDPLDHEKSKIRKSPKFDDMVLGIESLKFRDLSDKKLPKLFRFEPFMSFMVAHEELKNRFEKEKVTGLTFFKPEDTKF